MGRIVVTEFISLDGVVRGPGRLGELPARRLELRDQQRRRGPRVQGRGDPRVRRAAARPGDLRGLRRGLAVPGRRVRRPVQQHAQVRGLLDADRSDVEQLDRARRATCRRGREAEARARSATSSCTAAPARPVADRARSRRRAAPDGVPGRAGEAACACSGRRATRRPCSCRPRRSSATACPSSSTSLPDVSLPAGVQDANIRSCATRRTSCTPTPTRSSRRSSSGTIRACADVP